MGVGVGIAEFHTSILVLQLKPSVGDTVVTFAHLALDLLRPPALCIPPTPGAGVLPLPPCGPRVSCFFYCII